MLKERLFAELLPPPSLKNETKCFFSYSAIYCTKRKREGERERGKVRKIENERERERERVRKKL